MNKLYLRVLLTLFTLLVSTVCFGQNGPKDVAGIPVNYDDALAGAYTLPNPLIMENGDSVNNSEQWLNERRPQIVSLFEEFQFGKTPEVPKNLIFNVSEKGTPTLNGKAIRKQVTIYLTKDTAEHKMEVLIYLPLEAKKPVPLFLNISFLPNALTVDDPEVKTGYMWNKDEERVAIESKDGFKKLDINKFLSQGIGFATVYYGDIEPDFANGIKHGIRSQYLKNNEKYPADDEWGAISAWAWGLSCAMNYLETDSQIDSEKVALFGVSRLGKTVLWAGAHDTRFGMVIASCSGEGGAALSRRWYGETIDHMTHPTRYSYQFAGNWRKFKDDPSLSPIDSHLLIALIAPRPLLLQTGNTDYWSDPKGEFLAAVAAEPVYNMLGKEGLNTDKMPDVEKPILNDLGYYMHNGGHGTLPTDYDIFIEFMKKHFKR